MSRLCSPTPSLTLDPPSDTLQLMANDHFGVVPCLAAHKVLADTLATYLPSFRSPEVIWHFIATLLSDEITRLVPRTGVFRGSPLLGASPRASCLPHPSRVLRRLITATVRLRLHTA